MNKVEQFKVAFLEKCAKDGLTLEETHQVVKSALDKIAVFGLDRVIDLAGSAAGRVGSLATIGALAAPPLIGYAAGNMAASAADVDDTDVDEVKQKNLIAEYRRLTRDLLSRKRSPIA